MHILLRSFQIVRKSCSEVFFKIDPLKNSAKFTEKHLSQRCYICHTCTTSEFLALKVSYMLLHWILLGLLQVKKRNIWSYKKLQRNKEVTFKSYEDKFMNVMKTNVIHSIKDFDPIKIHNRLKYSFPFFLLYLHSVK